jgi:hypothetical protein
MCASQFPYKLRQVGLVILNFVGFVNDEVDPLVLFEVVVADADAFVGGDADIEFAGEQLSAEDFFTVRLGGD